MGADAQPSAKPPRTRSRRWPRWCARPWPPARSAWPAPPARRTTAPAARRCPRAWPSDEEHARTHRGHGRSGRGVYMVTKGAQMPVALLEQMAARARRPVMIAALLHNSTNPGAVFADLDAISAANAARPPTDRAGVVLPADDGLHHGLALPGGRPGELEARARQARQGLCAPCSPARRSATGCAHELADSHRPFASSTASGTRCMWWRWRSRATASWSSAACATSRSAWARTRWMRCSTSRSTKTWPPSSPRSCSTATRPRWRACSTTRTAWSRYRTPARTSRSSTTPGSGCTCWGIGCASAG